MNTNRIQQRFSTNLNMKPIIDKNSIDVARILSGKVSKDALLSLIDLLEEYYPPEDTNASYTTEDSA